MHGLKQHIRVARSFYRRRNQQLPQRNPFKTGSRAFESMSGLTRSAFFACSTASQGAGKSRNTAQEGTKNNEIRPSNQQSQPQGTNKRTCIDGVDDREALLAHVPVRERHDVVHPVPRELLPVRGRRQYRSIKDMEYGVRDSIRRVNVWENVGG